MKNVLIVGVGNPLLMDEGIGYHVVEQLEKEGGLPEGVELVQGETGGLTLLPALEEASAAVLVDAAEFGGAPGDVKIFQSQDILKSSVRALSVHGIGLCDVVSALSLKSESPPEILLLGIQPATLSVGLGISPELQRRIPTIIQIVRKKAGEFARRFCEEVKPTSTN